MFPYKLRIMYHLKHQDYVQRVAVSQCSIDNTSSDSGAYVELFFLMNVSFTNQNLLTRRRHEIEEQKSQARFPNMNHTEKVSFWYDVPAKHLVGPYFLNNETVRGGNYYQMLDT